MKIKLKKYWLLIVILVLAAFLRFYKLGTYPALNADEAAIGYNAYSLIQTGKDEHGNPWPIHFQSFNDYKPGLFFYFVLPLVKVLGLTELAVRIPGALLGVGTVLLIYFLAKELFTKNRLLPILAAFLLAISPWHIHYSRGGWEVNVATFFITLGVLFFIKAIKNKRYFVVSVISFVASLYTYHAARVVVPLLGLGLVVIYWQDIKKNFKPALLAGVVGILLLLPLARDLTTGAVASRAAGVGLFADTGPLARINEQRGEHSNLASPLAVVLHNKAVNYGLAFVANWVEHYWGEFLFLSGDEIQRNRVPETGQLYWYEIVTVLVGLLVLVKNFDRSAKTIIWWLLIAPVAAALTFQSPHALRAHNMVIALTTINALGFSVVLDWLKNTKFEKLRSGGLVLFGGLVFWSFICYQHQYWIHMAKEYPFSSQYGVKELIDYLKQEGDKHPLIVITDRYDQPYILTLFYLKYPPEKFQLEHELTVPDQYGFSTVRSFDKYRFRAFEFVEESNNSPGALILGTDEEIPDWANVVRNIYGANGHLYFQAVAN